jgi:hypothetical protein
MNNLLSYKEFRQRVSIIDLALANGYIVDKQKGRRWPVLRNRDFDDTIIIINPDDSSNQGYFNPKNDTDKGTIVEFIKYRLGVVFATPFQSEVKNINGVLYNWLRLDAPTTELHPVQPIVQFSANFLLPLTDTAWLESRGLRRKIIYDWEFSNRIFNQKTGKYVNISFPYYNSDAKIIACENRNAGYKMQTSGSDRSSGIWHSNMPVRLKFLILAESPIDAISYHQLKGAKDSMYIAFGGGIGQGQLKTLKLILDRADRVLDFVIIAGFDNDRQGEKYYNSVKEQFPLVIRDCPTLKDFNEDLCVKNEQGNLKCVN